MKKSLFLSAAFCLSCFLGGSLAIAQTCPAVTENHPSCEAMGFSQTMDCNGATTIIKCPFDTSYYFCHKIGSGGSTCDTSGVTMLSGTSDIGNLLTDGYCTHSPKKCAVSSQFMMAGIGSNNSIFSYEGLGCNPLYAQGAQLYTTSGDYDIGNNVYSEVLLNYYKAIMKGSAILKGDGNQFHVMYFGSNYNGGAVVLAGNSMITTIELATAKTVPLLVGDDSGKSVLLTLNAIVAASGTEGALCIGLRPGGSVLLSVPNETTTYNDVVSAKKEITAPTSGYYSSKPIVIATAEVCLGAAEGTTSGGSSSGGSGSSGSSGSCDTSYYKYTNCDSSTTVCSNTCTMNGTTYYSPSGCRYASGSNHQEYNGNPYCCDPSKYKYTSLPNGMTLTTFIEKCSDMYAPTLYYIPDGTQCENTAYTFNASQGKCCHISSGACL